MKHSAVILTLGRGPIPWSLPLSYGNLSLRRSLSPGLQLCFNKGWIILWPITFVVTHATRRLIKSQPSGHNPGSPRNLLPESGLGWGGPRPLLTHESLPIVPWFQVCAATLSHGRQNIPVSKTGGREPSGDQLSEPSASRLFLIFSIGNYGRRAVLSLSVSFALGSQSQDNL